MRAGSCSCWRGWWRGAGTRSSPCGPPQSLRSWSPSAWIRCTSSDSSRSVALVRRWYLIRQRCLIRQEGWLGAKFGAGPVGEEVGCLIRQWVLGTPTMVLAHVCDEVGCIITQWVLGVKDCAGRVCEDNVWSGCIFFRIIPSYSCVKRFCFQKDWTVGDVGGGVPDQATGVWESEIVPGWCARVPRQGMICSDLHQSSQLERGTLSSLF